MNENEPQLLAFNVWKLPQFRLICSQPFVSRAYSSLENMTRNSINVYRIFQDILIVDQKIRFWTPAPRQLNLELVSRYQILQRKRLKGGPCVAMTRGLPLAPNYKVSNTISETFF